MSDAVLSQAPAKGVHHGCLVLVVGPSGAGKDTLIHYARERLDGNRSFVFPRRIITREAEPSFEDHDTVDPAQFHAMLAESQFALHWEAHGLLYGVPSTIHEDLARGAVVIVNVSRSVVPFARQRYANVLVVTITAPADILAQRLGQRGREDPVEIGQRLARKSQNPGPDNSVLIVNDGPIDRAGDAFLALLAERLIGERP